MKTTAVRLYGAGDLRMETFELPPTKEDEILLRIVSDGLCMSSYKAAIQGNKHKRVPKDIAENPIIIGHESCGIIEQVGRKWTHAFSAGQKVALQPALKYQGSYGAPGYSYPYIGGNAIYVVVPNEVMESDCLLPYYGDAFFHGSLAEPLSCIIGAFRSNYHSKTGDYVHTMGIKDGGACAILGGCGPMGLGAIDYALHSKNRPELIVVTDIDDTRIARAASIYPENRDPATGTRLVYMNTASVDDPNAFMRALTGGAGFDDVFVFAPVEAVAALGSRILGYDGCLNIFAGPVDNQFSASINLYEVHYSYQHVVGSSGGNNEDMKTALALMEVGAIDPAPMVTHIGGLNCTAETTLQLPTIPGGKKMIYTGINLPLTPLWDLEKTAAAAPKEQANLFYALHEILSGNNGLWCVEAEQYLLAHAPALS